MMKKTLQTATAMTALALALSGCAAKSPEPKKSSEPSASASPTAGSGGSAHGGMRGKPGSCPAMSTLTTPLKKVVTMDAAAAAFLIELGVGDRIVGTAGTDFKTDYTGEMRKRLDALTVIDPGRGNKEAVIAAKPDLVTGISIFQLGGFEGTPSQEVLKSNGIAAMVACGNQRGETTNIDATYQYVTNLAKTFGVEKKGEEIVSSLKKKAEQAQGEKGSTPVLTLSAAPTGGTGIRTSGGSSFANGVITMAGGKNVAAGTQSNFASLSAEQIAQDNPKVIVAVSGFSKDSDEQLVASIKSSPLLANTDAVKKNNIVVVPQRILLSPSLLNSEAISKIAEAIKAAS